MPHLIISDYRKDNRESKVCIPPESVKRLFAPENRE